MRRAIIVLLAIGLCLGVRLGNAQSANQASAPPAAFGSCAEWSSQNTATNRDTYQMYRIGVAHGIAFGIGAGAHSYITGATSSVPRSFLDLYQRGYAAVLRRPAILVEAFDAKCADYRNANLSVMDLGYLAILEIGGAEEERVSQALQILRTRTASTEFAAKRFDICSCSFRP